MALLSDRTRNATIRACTATDVLIIPKTEFNKLRQSVPAFGDFFRNLACARALAASSHSSAETSHDSPQGALHAVSKFDRLDPIEPYTSKTATKMKFIEDQDRAEPTPDEMMHEPIIRLMMESDHVTEEALRRIITIARGHLDRGPQQHQDAWQLSADLLLY
jgi:hypothetical protein